jgi:hypothetical protein
MSLLLVLLLAQAEPRYLGGAQPHPLNEVGPVDERPSVAACSLETLRSGRSCLLDGRPAPATDHASQLRSNVKIAREVGESLCRSRQAGAPDDPEAALRACLARVERAASGCSLDGAEPLLDADGHFSQRAQPCYANLATAIQLTVVPAAETKDAARRSAPTPKKQIPGAQEFL